MMCLIPYHCSNRAGRDSSTYEALQKLEVQQGDRELKRKYLDSETEKEVSTDSFVFFSHRKEYHNGFL